MKYFPSAKPRSIYVPIYIYFETNFSQIRYCKINSVLNLHYYGVGRRTNKYYGFRVNILNFPGLLRGFSPLSSPQIAPLNPSEFSIFIFIYQTFSSSAGQTLTRSTKPPRETLRRVPYTANRIQCVGGPYPNTRDAARADRSATAVEIGRSLSRSLFLFHPSTTLSQITVAERCRNTNAVRGRIQTVHSI